MASSSSSNAGLDRRALIASIGVGALAASCASRVDGYRFRIDFRLIVNGVLKQARTVRSVEWRRLSKWLLAGEGPFLSVHGSAAAIDIDANRTLFLTMGKYYDLNGERRYGAPWTPERYFIDRNLASEIIDGRVLMDRDPKYIYALAPHELPVLATFEDPGRASSGRVIRPEDLTSEFPGVELGRSTFQYTHEWVTRGDVRRRLPWLDEETAWRSLEPGLFVI